MDPLYALKRLHAHASAVRTAQRAYYACPGDPRTDQLKKDHLAESKRREADLDTLLASIPRIFPQILENEKPKIPEGAQSVPEINKSRLTTWIDLLNNYNAVPQVLIAVGMGSSIGKLVVLRKEDLTPESITTFLKGAIYQVEGH